MERTYQVYFYRNCSYEIFYVETIKVKIGMDILTEAKKMVRTGYYLDSIREVLPAPSVETCQACQEEQPNQLAHMNPGGCLYSAE